MKRTRAYYRSQRERTIRRKINIIKNIWSKESVEDSLLNPRTKGKFAKGKIHCSCWMCQTKSCNELTARDKSKLESAELQLQEFYRNCSNKDFPS